MNQLDNSDRDQRLVSDQFPRSSAYHPDWVMANAMGSNSMWLTEWLSTVMELQPGMRVLDLGCGRAVSSVFLAREFDVQVWATDLWISASENIQRIRDAGCLDRVFPLHADARSLPFAAGFFDAIIVIDSFSYYGTDDLYLNYLANFVKPGGQIGIAGAGIMRELEVVPDHLREMWTEDFWCLHSADWWRRHWARTQIVDVEVADTMEDGWKTWIAWHETAHPDNNLELDTLKADRGENLGYVRMVGRRRKEAALVDYCWPDNLRFFPPEYAQHPLLRNESA
ncbi:MAG TPA: methyltransferase domain-containing protein [Pirellulaceae bacterium]|nr:methyltransferase domain-containing protein [Pirellulaceae bacterium]